MRRYTPSSAREEFESSLGEIRRVLPMVGPSRQLNADLKNYVLGASVLFLHAKLENYISDLFKGICQQACEKQAAATEIPEPLLGWMFLADGHLERSRMFIARNEEHAFIESTGEYLSTKLLRESSNYVTVNRFKTIDDKCYPSVKNLKRMFNRIGLKGIFGRLNARLRRQVELELRSLNALRGALAHSGVDGQLSQTEIRERVKNTQQLVAAIDKETFYHLRRTFHVDVWKSP